MNPQFIYRRILPVLLVLYTSQISVAQTDNDYDMMAKGLLCVGPMVSYSSWDHYWEGKLKRTNENLGTVSTNVYSLMGNYGISKKVNVLFNLPYVQTNASAGNLKGQKGFQDLSFFVKYMPLNKKVGPGKFRLALVGGLSTPLTDYTPDHLPLSLGLGSTNLSGRLIVDYEYSRLFLTASGSYARRSNVTIDRTAYYTTEMHYTNEVKMPDMASLNIRFGYRGPSLIAEVVANHFKTLGGFDISRNNMPFPSNRMNGTTVGPAIKWRPDKKKRLQLVGGSDFVLSGRNIGQGTTWYGGMFYILPVMKTKSAQPQN
ncbi:MAG: hypothetical protein ACXWV4_02300 [Flavitalea sp.]